jgi:hypothetical protein
VLGIIYPSMPSPIESVVRTGKETAGPCASLCRKTRLSLGNELTRTHVE